MLKDRLVVKDFKREIADMWRVVLDHFPLVWLSLKKWAMDPRTNKRMDRQTDRHISFKDAWVHLKTAKTQDSHEFRLVN